MNECAAQGPVLGRAPAADVFSNAIRDLSPDSVVPFHGRVWVERIPPAAMTAKGLEIPIQARESAGYGIVRNVGEGVTAPIRPGDVVMVEAYDGDNLTFGSRIFVLVNADAVKAKLCVTPSALDMDNRCPQE